jgi:hypothetical protein
LTGKPSDWTIGRSSDSADYMDRLSGHIAVSLLEQNAGQIQPTLKRVITPGDPLYGTFFTLLQSWPGSGRLLRRLQAVQKLPAAGNRKLQNYGAKTFT